MRWFVLYARSRGVPAAFAVIVLGILAAWLFELEGPRLAALVLGLGAAVAASGLGGADVSLDRTAAIGWPVRRAGHLAVLCGVPAGLVIAADLAPAELIVRDAAGLTGLAALGAVALGRQLAWTLPLTWTVIAVTFPFNEVVAWMTMPVETTKATVTAVVLCGVGTAAYTARGTTFG